ncbi:DivIVA domain-containing protein [Clostridium kluyveri]|uniref:Cell division protein DivIVA n=1 Tax=Clostridium kluyveri TaxID=1534 RepID=A0A1L5F6E2_CLOKL|nr:DivIVA domain-containing protein [Clostridium kluyveri]APM38581.1 cell division protein DivIVA [Clostridium kluyveri]
MLITAGEITNKEFKKGLRGYNIDEVDEFLDKIAESYEAMCKENSLLKEKLQLMEDKVNHYNKMENTIKGTLLLAQNTSEQVKENAKKESECILKNANDTAQKIIDKAHSDVIQINDEFERVKQEFSKFRTKFRSFVKTQLEMFDDMEKDFVKNYDIGYEVDEIPEENIQVKSIEKVEPKGIEFSPSLRESNLNKEEYAEPIVDKDDVYVDKYDTKEIGDIKDEIFTEEDELEEIKNFFVRG